MPHFIERLEKSMLMEDRILITLTKYLIEHGNNLSEEEKNDLEEQKNYMAKRVARRKCYQYAITQH